MIKSEQARRDAELERLWLDARANGLTTGQLAVRLGCTKRKLFERRQGVEQRLGRTLPALGGRTLADVNGVIRGYKPEHDMTHTVPEGFAVKGVSSYYDAQGNLRGQWVKSREDLRQQGEMLAAAVEALGEPIRGLAKPVKAPVIKCDGRLSAYIVGDAHFGMYAWQAEAGEDFDLMIADQDLRAAFDHLIQSAPFSETGLLVDVGDFLHSDNRTNMTPASGNLLDVDTRYQKVIRVAVMALRYAVEQMLRKHAKVKLIVAPGNHNPDSAGWMALTLQMFYESEPRVEVDTSPAKFFYHRHGDVLIGVTHGDKIKLAELPAIMAVDRAKDWGESKHRYFWTGHIHHTKHQEYRGCFVESFNTLAASDAWHAASGYRSQRQMQRIDIDPEHGICSRAICNLGMLRDAEAKAASRRLKRPSKQSRTRRAA